MKTFVLSLLAALLALCPAPSLAALQVVTTTEDLAALVQAVGGAQVSVQAIARGDLDPHFIDAKPSFMLKLANADLVVCIGMELEVGWLPSLLTGSRNPKVQAGTAGYLDASRTIQAIEVPTGSIDRSRGDLHAQGNPHYWLDPENGRVVARVLAERLGQIDPAHVAAYQGNLGAFEQMLTTKQAVWAAQMAPLRGTAVVGYHSTFDYFCARHGLRVVGFIEPKPGIPPAPAHTLQLGATAKEAHARFVLVEPFHDPRDARPVAEAAGAKVVQLPSSVGATAKIHTYFDLFDALVAALTT